MKTRTIWLLGSAAVLLLGVLCSTAWATSCGTGGLTTWDAQSGVCRPVTVPTTQPMPAPATPSGPVSASSISTSDATGVAGADARSGGSSSSVTGGDSRLYVLPAPVAATPLPAGMCQRSSSRAFAIGWNLVSAARADSETDVECLERAFAAMPRAQAPVVLSDPRNVRSEPVGQAVDLQPASALAIAPAAGHRKADKPKARHRRPAAAHAADTPPERVIPTCQVGEVLACAKLMEVW